jgi:DNA-binding NarL/FixJ family response regulator
MLSRTPHTRILVIDEHELIRYGIRHALAGHAEFQIVGEAATFAMGRLLVATVRSDVVIVDVRLPDGSGIEFARLVRNTSESLGIVVLAARGGDTELFGALNAGASAFVPKTAPADEIVAAVRHAKLRPASFAAMDLHAALERKLSYQTSPRLSPREIQILRLLASGRTVAVVAKEIGIAGSTVKNHITSMYEKLGATTRAQAMVIAAKRGLLEADDLPPVIT